ncbi:DUF5683 domain-containing protein [Bacteroidales bacterium OttesenSCG-928-M06]|nr:DUF5683 domain-containing protein [Bacteroidales bacterium OttesenSCG-928-M06]
MKNYILLIIGLLVGFPVSIYSQDNSFLEADTIRVLDGFSVESDTLNADSLSVESIVNVSQIEEKLEVTKKKFVPDPTKAVLYSAAFPGLGQLYNRKYWKLPIVYGGFIGCAYAITWNHKTYVDYRDAYKDLVDNDPNTTSWMNYGTNEDYLKSVLRSRRDRFRRYRDLSCFIAIGLYAVCMIDAYVDAQLFEFDISEDLSMRVDPVIFNKTAHNPRGVGFQCSFTF